MTGYIRELVLQRNDRLFSHASNDLPPAYVAFFLFFFFGGGGRVACYSRLNHVSCFHLRGY